MPNELVIREINELRAAKNKRIDELQYQIQQCQIKIQEARAEIKSLQITVAALNAAYPEPV